MIKKNMLKKVMGVCMAATLVMSMTGCSTADSKAPAKEQTSAAEAVKTEEAETTAELSNAEKWGIDEFTFVLIPGEDSEKDVQLRDSVAEDLSEVLDLPVNVYRATDYNAAVEAMRTGNAQLVWLGAFSYVTAVERAGAECICVKSRDGETGYHSLILAKPDSGINGLADLEGKNFGFVEPSSTSGNIVPSNDILNELGLDLSFDELHMDGKFFDTVTYVGNHQASLQAVLQGNVDAAAISSNTYNNQIEKGNVKESDFKIVHSSVTIPGSVISIQKDLPEDLKQQVTDFLLSYDNEEFLGDPGYKFVAVEDSEYDVIRELQEKYGLTD